MGSWAKIVVLGLAVVGYCGRLHGQQAQSTAPELPTLSPRLPPPWLFPPPPDPLPSPADAPMPDLGKLQGSPDKSRSPVKRAIHRLAPRCLDAVTHTCWSSPSGGAPPKTAEAERKFQNDMDAGDLYFKHRNYTGAELRFRDAFNYKPNEPDATFKLAETLSQQRKNDEARALYEAYLKIQPRGRYSERARKGLQRLQKESAQK